MCHMLASWNDEVLRGLITWCSLPGGIITHSRCIVVFRFKSSIGIVSCSAGRQYVLCDRVLCIREGTKPDKSDLQHGPPAVQHVLHSRFRGPALLGVARLLSNICTVQMAWEAEVPGVSQWPPWTSWRSMITPENVSRH